MAERKAAGMCRRKDLREESESMTLLERPILFPGEMVRAILANRKTQTRRVVKPQPQVELFPFIGRDNQPTGEFAFVDSPRVVSKHVKCPYGTVGSRLWVRETFNEYCPLWDGAWCGHGEEDGKAKDHKLVYRATNPNGELEIIKEDEAKRIAVNIWKSPIHMPRWASRLTLEIQSVRVERIQDISYEDALAEGCADFGPLVEAHRKTCCEPETGDDTARRLRWPQREFERLWDKINPKRGFGWAENPWVWCLTFKVLKDAEEVGTV